MDAADIPKPKTQQTRKTPFMPAPEPSKTDL